MGKWTHKKFIRYDNQGYLLFSSTLMRYINERYNKPTSAFVGVNDRERVIRLTLNRSGNGYCISSNGTGSGGKTSLGRGKKVTGLEHKRYFDLEYGNDYIEMRY